MSGVVASRLQLRTQYPNVAPDRQTANQHPTTSTPRSPTPYSISCEERSMDNNTDRAGDMSPMLDRFVGEPRRAGHFNSLWAQSFAQDLHLVGRQPGQYNAAPAQRRANEVQAMEQGHISSQGQRVTISTVQEQDLAQVGAWTK